MWSYGFHDYPGYRAKTAVMLWAPPAAFAACARHGLGLRRAVSPQGLATSIEKHCGRFSTCGPDAARPTSHVSGLEHETSKSDG
jgi:hypothetical protein